jgi:general secretion pathway protein E
MAASALGELLLERGIIDAATLAQLEKVRQSNPQKLASLIIDMGVLSPDALYSLLSDHAGIPLWDGEGEPCLDPRLPDNFIEYNRILPVQRPEGLWLIVDDAEDDGLRAMLRRLLPEATLALCPPARLQQHLGSLLGTDVADKEDDAEKPFALDDVSHLKDLALEAPIIRLVNDMIGEGVTASASDIHLEPYKTRIELRYRIDGVMHNASPPSVADYPAVVSRIKILANLDIAERRLPQDGRIRIRTGGREVDIRVSTLPARHGEDIVLRLLDQKRQSLSLAATGLTERVITRYHEALQRSNGLILITGPTGSGKSTTLYSGINEIIDGKKKIITVEDPVEYELPGITQIQVNEGAGLTFSSVLRSILRHDPDVVFVGEIRDRETAEIAIQASLTGHLVLSTIHTNSATGAIARFLDMGIPDYLLASSLIAVTAQRLVRRLCDHCKQGEPADADTRARFGMAEGQIIYRATGCPQCARTGYRGRFALAEFLEMTPQLRHQILQNPSADALYSVARDANGFLNLIDDGVAKASAGLTTLEEVLRVAG